jgi:hypothetical protein
MFDIKTLNETFSSSSSFFISVFLGGVDQRIHSVSEVSYATLVDANNQAGLWFLYLSVSVFLYFSA